METVYTLGPGFFLATIEYSVVIMGDYVQYRYVNPSLVTNILVQFPSTTLLVSVTGARRR